MNIEEKKADFMRRFKASRERKAEYIAQMEKQMRDDYRRRTGKEAESFCVLQCLAIKQVQVDKYNIPHSSGDKCRAILQ